MAFVAWQPCPWLFACHAGGVLLIWACLLAALCDAGVTVASSRRQEACLERETVPPQGCASDRPQHGRQS